MDGLSVVQNPGYIPRTCERIDLGVGEHSIKLRYIHGGDAASASASYRRLHTLKRMPMAPITSLSPGWCSGSTAPRTSCFGNLPTDKCAIEFGENAAAGEVVESWNIAFRLQTPLAVGQYVDVSLPGFGKEVSVQDSDSERTDAAIPSATTVAGTKTRFAFQVLAKSLDPGFPETLPDPGPRYAKIGCYEDVRTQRAVGGGTCGNFKDADAVVPTVEACARIAAERGFGGFCISEGSMCHTSREFFLQYDTYNKSDELGELEALAKEQFQREIQAEIEACMNASNVSSAQFTAHTVDTSDAHAWLNGSLCAPSREFVFNVTGVKGCLQGGMGGAESMSCYELIRTPKLAAKIAPSIRCGECGEWDAATQTMRFVAEEYVEAGLDITLGFNSSVLQLRAPVYGLARDDKSVTLFHSGDVRDVKERDKERAICAMPPIKSSNNATRGASCVPPTVSTTVQV
jgi:hypothetical protein